MNNNWEDWNFDNCIIPNLKSPTEKQIKALTERKLVEESDNALTKELFSNDTKKEIITLRKIKKNIPIKQTK